MPLVLGKGLELPEDAVTQTMVVYGGKGMGKTVFGAVLAEELARKRKRFSVIDPVGRSWGLRWGADGKSDGLKILILGGRHGDLPIHPKGGAAIADLVVNEDVDTLIDISSHADGKGWTHGEKLRFVGDYCNRLYEEGQRRRRPMMQIIDEAGRFAMQQIPHGAVDAAHCLGAVEQLVELGRNAGIGVCLITQRSARMAKSVSELASAMIAFRTVGPNSVQAILDWFGEHVEKPKWKLLLEQLRTLTIGEALVVSPGWLELEQAFKIRMRHTFDSSATPKGGGDHRVSGGRAPNLDKYRKLMADTVAAAEAMDPKKLQAKLQAAEAEIRKLQQAKPPVAAKPQQVATIVEKIVKVPALTEDQLERMLGRIDGAVRTLHDNVLSQVAGLRNAVIETKNANGKISHGASAVRTLPAKPIPAPSAGKLQTVTVPRKADAPTQVVGTDGKAPSGGLRRIMISLAQCPNGLTRSQIAVRAGLRQSGSFRNYMSTARTSGWLTSNGTQNYITEAGVAALGEYEPLPSGSGLFDYWVKDLGGGASRILQAVHADRRQGLTREQISEQTGLAQSGSFRNYMSKLNTLQLIERNADGLVIASEDLYDT